MSVQRLLRCVALMSCVTAAVGCAGGVSAGGLFAAAVFVLGLGLAGCKPDEGKRDDVEECDGNWESSCDEGVLTEVCCPEGAACNYEAGLQICADGSCAYYPEACAEECDGRWEQACEEGVTVDACCPGGAACNYGMGIEFCDDGSCVRITDGEECP